MANSKHATTFAGRPVEIYHPGSSNKGAANVVYRLVTDDDAQGKDVPFAELLDRFLSEHGGPDLTALVVGAWKYDDMLEWGRGAADLIEALVAARDRMSNLQALFFGDITYQECEMSWIGHGDVSPLLPAFPKLQEFRIRGTNNVTFGKIKHDALRSLAIESGGMAETVLQEVWQAELPQLTHLELWLGTENYGGISTTEPLAPLLSDNVFDGLKSLGLRNCQIADEVAKAVVASPLLEWLEVLDLSLGTIGDEGAQALLASLAVRNLKKLDLHRHYISPAVVKQLEALPIEVDVSDPQGEDEEDRYVMVGE